MDGATRPYSISVKLPQVTSRSQGSLDGRTLKISKDEFLCRLKGSARPTDSFDATFYDS